MERYIHKFLISLLILSVGTSTFSIAQNAAKTSIEDDVYDSDITARKVVYKPYVALPKAEKKAVEQDYADNDDDEYYSDDNQDRQNSYSDNDRYNNDYNYSSRIDRFHRYNNYTWRNYYGSNFGCNGFCDDPFFYGYNNFYNPGLSINIGFGNPFWGNSWGMGWNNWNSFGSMNPWNNWGGMYSWYNPVFYGNAWGNGWNNGWGNGWNNGWNGGGWNNGGGFYTPAVRNTPRPEGGYRGVRTDNSGNNSGRGDANVRPSGNGSNVGVLEGRPTRDGVRPTNNQPDNNDRMDVPSNGRPTRDNVRPSYNQPAENNGRTDAPTRPTMTRPNRGDDGSRSREDQNIINNTPNENMRRNDAPAQRPAREQARPNNDRSRSSDAPQPTRTERRPARQDSGYEPSRPSDFGGGRSNGGGGNYGGGGGNGGGGGGNSGGGGRPARN